MAGGQNQWPPAGGGIGQPGFASGGPNDPAMGGSGYMGGGQGGGWGGNYGFKPKGPTQWAGPNARYPNWNDDPSSGYANDVALINAGPWPGGGGGMGGGGWPGMGGGWGGPWAGGGGGFGPGLMWDVQDGPGSGMWGDQSGQPSGNGGAPEGFQPPTSAMVQHVMQDFYNPETGETWTASSGGWTPPAGWVRGKPGEQSAVEEGGGDVAASPFDWGSVGAGRLAKAQEFAALGKMGRAKQVFTSGEKGGAWSPEISQQLRTFKTGG